MFDFSGIKLVKESTDTNFFVGIRKSPSSSDFEFCLPHGFEEFPEGDFDEIRNLFFRMYRTFRKFEQDNINTNKFALNKPEYQNNQDETTLSSSGVSLQTGEVEVVLYSKIKMIERILEAYDDLVINSIQKKIRRSEEIDYSQIHRYLDRAIYLDNDVIYIDSMDLPRPAIRYESTDLVNLYCYILDELVSQLQGDVPENIKARFQDIQFLSQHFQDAYLTTNQSIFDKDTFNETVGILKEALDNIDKNTYYKDADYWQIYEAIEIFLYGEIKPDQTDGDFWGIKGFSILWEDMCHTFFFKQYQQDILYADTDVTLKDYVNSHREDSEINRVGNYSTYYGWIYRTISNISYPNNSGYFCWNELLCIELDLEPAIKGVPQFYKSKPSSKGFADATIRKTTVKPQLKEKPSNSINCDDLNKRDRSKTKFHRFPKPDLILKNTENLLEVRIVDYKYVPINFYTNPNLSDKKFKTDIIKQLTYELAIQQTHNVSESWFFIPYFYKSVPQNPWGEIAFPLKNNGNHTGIDIFKANFQLIQKTYLDENL